MSVSPEVLPDPGFGVGVGVCVFTGERQGLSFVSLL